MGGQHISPVEKQMIIKVYNYFKSEASNGRLRIKVSDYFKRTSHIFKISKSTLARIIDDKNTGTEGNEEVTNRKIGTNEKLDDFQKDVIKRSVYKFYERNEMMTIKRLKSYLSENEDMDVSKYILLKLLHRMGFKYSKDCSQCRDVICERPDLVRLRSSFLRGIKRRREEGYTVVYTDETWVNSSHTAPYQWHPPDSKDDRKLPTNRGEPSYSVTRR